LHIASAGKPEKNEIAVSAEPLTAETEVVPFSAADAFRLLLADYSAELKTLREVPKPNRSEAERIQKLELGIRNILATYDKVVNIAPIVLAVSVQFGLEIPTPLFSKLPLLNKVKFMTPGGQVTGGITIAVSRQKSSGKMGLSNFVIGASSIAGVNGTAGKRVQGSARPGTSGINWITPAIVVTIPLQQEIEAQKMGDLQGVYFGGAGELSTDTGQMGAVPRTYQLGVYAKPNGLNLTFPEVGMLFFFHGTGGQDRPVSGQAEALWFSVFASNDGSTVRSPIPMTGNYSTSPHASAQRKQELQNAFKEVNGFSTEELLKAAAEAQEGMKE
jgi:hypothetical protein